MKKTLSTLILILFTEMNFATATTDYPAMKISSASDTSITVFRIYSFCMGDTTTKRDKYYDWEPSEIYGGIGRDEHMIEIWSENLQRYTYNEVIKEEKGDVVYKCVDKDGVRCIVAFSDKKIKNSSYTEHIITIVYKNCRWKYKAYIL